MLLCFTALLGKQLNPHIMKAIINKVLHALEELGQGAGKAMRS